CSFFGVRFPWLVGVCGDVAVSVRWLVPLLGRSSDRGWRETIERNVESWWQTMHDEAMVEAWPVNPMRIFSELSARLPDDAIVVADSGSAANWYARQLKFRGAMRGSLSGTLATMGPGVPYGIGAKFGLPDRPVVVLE